MVTRCEYLLNRWWISICNLAAKRSLVDLFFLRVAMEGRCPGCCVCCVIGAHLVSWRFPADLNEILKLCLFFFSWLVFFFFRSHGDSPRIISIWGCVLRVNLTRAQFWRKVARSPCRRDGHPTNYWLVKLKYFFKSFIPFLAGITYLYTRWFQICFIFTPTWGDDPIWLLHIFFQWVG